MLDIISSISLPSAHGLENEDRAGTVQVGSSLYAWIVDGGTSVADRSYLAQDVGDVAWFSGALSDAIMLYAHSEPSPRELHRLAIEDVAKEFFDRVAFLGVSVPLYAQPIAAVSILRIHNKSGREVGDIFQLADCPVFLETDGCVDRVTASDGQGERTLRARVLSSGREAYADSSEIMASQLGWLRSRREEQIQAGILQISTVQAGACFGGSDFSFDAAKFENVVMMSDGLERYVSCYDLGDDADLIAEIKRLGSEQVLCRVRAVEQEDRLCRRYPRLKNSDDASCIVLARKSAH